MKFRTEIEIRRSPRQLAPTDRLVTIGSCFSDAIGRRLATDGFDVAVNPLGVLFNPLSIATVIERALEARPYTAADLYRHTDGTFHCLDLESRRQGPDPDRLLDGLNRDLADMADRLARADRVIVTFGTAWVFAHRPSDGRIVGNCHKLPDADFVRRLATVDEITTRWQPLADRLPLLLTVSPVRHLNDGLHGNTLSKSILHLAVDALGPAAEYFPAFEIVNDDLRDYRFYADDLKHPSRAAEDYVYERFGDMFFTRETAAAALEARRRALRDAHRPIIN